MIKKIIKLLFILVVIMLIYANYPTIKKTLINTYSDIESYVEKNGLNELKAKGYLIKESEVNNLKDSGINGSSVTVNENFYPYYNLLDETEKKLYKQIYANAENLSNEFIPNVVINKDKLNEVIEAVYNDHPEIFWLDTSYGYKYKEDNTCAQITLHFNETANNIENSKQKFEANVNRIIENANKLNNDYQKEKYAHDALNNFIEYDTSAPLNQSAYSAIVNGRTVCAGYAKSFQYIMTKLGIPTYYVTGTATGPHAWNIIKLSDGYYNVDLTWDDTKKTGSYAYFNLTDEKISKNHTRSEKSNYLPSCSATKYQYGYLDKAGEIADKIINRKQEE